MVFSRKVAKFIVIIILKLRLIKTSFRFFILPSLRFILKGYFNIYKSRIVFVYV